MFFLPLLLLLHFTDASIRLQRSILYDEVDFRDVDQITTDMCAAGCKLYATIAITDANKRIADGIIIVNPNTQARTSIAELSRLFMQDSREKAYLEIGNAPTVTILNTNANRESAPLALWIVSTNSPYFRTAEVYEPLNLIRTKAAASVPITILSAYPFTVTVKPGGANQVFAKAAGYDTIDTDAPDNCYVVFNRDFAEPFAGFVLGINGPLLTLGYDIAKYPRYELELSATNTISFDLNPFPQQPTFVSSPGFMCGGASHQVYRSSALSTGNTYTLRTPNDREMRMTFSIDMDTDGAHPVSIYDHKTTLNHPFSGNFKDGTNSVLVYNLQTYRATVSFAGTGDAFYGLRAAAVDLDDDDGSKTKTTTSGREVTTSSTGAPSLSVIGLALFVAAAFA